jgi:RNA polymerase sigma-B factor
MTEDRTHLTREKFVEFARTRDKRLRDELIEAHIGLANQLARRFSDRGEPNDDLAQVASIGLINSVDRFDPERGVEFSTFATRTVVGELKRHFRDKGWAVRAPRRIQELYLELGHTIESLTQSQGRPPTIREMAQAIGSTEEKVLEALEAGQGYRATSIDAPDREDESLSARLGDVDKSLGTAEERVMLAPMLARLPPRDQVVLRLRFMDGMTQSDIAKKIGISQMHVSRLISASLARLRESLVE